MTIQHVICNKEAEIATMAIKLDNIEKTVTEVKKDLKDFISCADNKYATKEELLEVKANLKDTTSKVWDIIQKVSSIGATVAVMYLIVKGGL